MKKIGLVLILAFIVELAFMIMVGQWVSGWLIFGWLIVAAVLGVSLLRKNITALAPMMQGGLPNTKSDISTALLQVFCGILLVFPGLLGDAVALVLLLPPVQKLLKVQAAAMLQKRQKSMLEGLMNQMGGGMGGGMPNGQADFMEQLRKKMEEMQASGAQQGDRGTQYTSSQHRQRRAPEIIDIVAEPVKKNIHKSKEAAND